MVSHPRKIQHQGFCLKQGAYDCVCCVCWTCGLVFDGVILQCVAKVFWARWRISCCLSDEGAQCNGKLGPDLPRFVWTGGRGTGSTSIHYRVMKCWPDLLRFVGLLFSGPNWDGGTSYGPLYYHLKCGVSCGPRPSSLHSSFLRFGLLQRSIRRKGVYNHFGSVLCG